MRHCGLGEYIKTERERGMGLGRAVIFGAAEKSVCPKCSFGPNVMPRMLRSLHSFEDSVSIHHNATNTGSRTMRLLKTLLRSDLHSIHFFPTKKFVADLPEYRMPSNFHCIWQLHSKQTCPCNHPIGQMASNHIYHPPSYSREQPLIYQRRWSLWRAGLIRDSLSN